ncbi:MAG: Hpt domain-containing protein, partial [Selenomonadaceae bacterium]|nr:Hpt domain-containing protein [Selenomonadaceae bacterium]
DAESYLELLQIFYESIDEKTEEIDGFYAAEDLKDYTIKVHALKSSARIIGAKDFGEEAQKLENAGKSGDLDYIRAHHADFLETCRSFRAPLAEVFAVSKAEEGAGEEKPEADEKQMEGIYKELRAAAEEMDCERLDAIFARMEGYRIPAKDAELYGKLKAASDRFDYDSVLSLLDTRIR